MSKCWLIYHLSLFDAVCGVIAVTWFKYLIHIILHFFLLEHPLPCHQQKKKKKKKKKEKKNSPGSSVCTVDLACNLLRLKSSPSKRYLIAIPLSPSWKASASMAENIMLNMAENIKDTQPCLTPFVTGNGYRNSESFWSRASISSWNCRTIAINLAGQPNFAGCVKCFGKIDKGYVEVHILFLGFLLKLSCSENHINCFSVLPEFTLAFW